MSDRDGNREIYAFSVAGAAEVNLSRNPASDETPSWIALEGGT